MRNEPNNGSNNERDRNPSDPFSERVQKLARDLQSSTQSLALRKDADLVTATFSNILRDHAADWQMTVLPNKDERELSYLRRIGTAHRMALRSETRSEKDIQNATHLLTVMNATRDELSKLPKRRTLGRRISDLPKPTLPQRPYTLVKFRCDMAEQLSDEIAIRARFPKRRS